MTVYQGDATAVEQLVKRLRANTMIPYITIHKTADCIEALQAYNTWLREQSDLVGKALNAECGVLARLATAEAVVEQADEVATRMLVLKTVGKLQLDPGLNTEHDKLLDILKAHDEATS